MIPKEKAIELVGKMCLNDCTDKNIKLAKQFALIAADEIIELLWHTHKNIDEYNFWKDVKQELEKL